MGHHHGHDHQDNHHHHHGHGHHHHAPDNFNRAFAIAVLANLAFTGIEAFYAIMAHSMSLLADAGHNLGDVLGLLMAWIASWLLTIKPSRKFSYGYKRTTILAALGNAILLILASAIILRESIEKLMHPAAVHEPTVMIVAAIGIFVNGATAMLFARGSKDDINIKGAFMHLAADALISVGVVITGAVILWTGWYALDPIVGIAIVVAIVIGTWGLLRDSVNLIMDAVPHWVDAKGVKAYLENFNGGCDVHDLHIWGLSTKGAALTAHVVHPKGTFSDAQYAEINEHLEHHFKIDHATIQVEMGACEHVDCGDH